MSESIRLGEIVVAITRKAVKHAHLSVHPPRGRVSLVVPMATRTEVARAFAISKLGWIRSQQAAFRSQARETPRRFVTRESHFLWGRRYLLAVVERPAVPGVTVSNRRITLSVRPRSTRAQREAVMNAWQRAQMHAAVPKLIAKWQARLGVQVRQYFLQRMKTKWGSCNRVRHSIRLNTELARKPRDLLEYVVLHEMLHLLEPRHSERFVELLGHHYPGWREARLELNLLPLAT